MKPFRKKLIEVALPLEDINREAAREKSIRHGHPSSLHLWWARRPLAACRAVLFGSLVDDPSGYVPELMADQDKGRAAEKTLAGLRKAWKEQKLVFDKARAAGMTTVPDPGPEPKLEEIIEERERERLFGVIRELVRWENSNEERVLNKARGEIARSVARNRGETAPQKPAEVLAYLAKNAPPVYDPFCGGGSIPLEAQRLGLEAHASDLNPVPVLINKALIEIPPKFAGKPPVNPESRKKFGNTGTWKGAAGLAEDIRYYGQWMRDEAEKRIGHLYPKVKLPKEHGGGEGTVIAWLWARTVVSPNPAAKGAHVPLVSSFWLSKKEGKETWLELSANNGAVRFDVRKGKPQNPAAVDAGTKLGKGGGFSCALTGIPITNEHIRAEGSAGRLGVQLLATVVEGNRSRIYLPPTGQMEAVALAAKPIWKPCGSVPERLTGGTCFGYGLREWGDLFTSRQLASLQTLCELVAEARSAVENDTRDSGWRDDAKALVENGVGPIAYGEAVSVYLSFVVDKVAESLSSLCTWSSAPKNELVVSTFRRQALPMTWDFGESNPFADSSGSVSKIAQAVARVVDQLAPAANGWVVQCDATKLATKGMVFSTDPPYFDNISYADLSEFFYVWMRKNLSSVYPDIFGTIAPPKSTELVAASYRHNSREEAEGFFVEGMRTALDKLAEGCQADFPLTIYYAFKQAETEEVGTASTGWETFLAAILGAGFAIDGTWPIRTERAERSVSIDTNALASSIVLVCRPRPKDAGVASRRDFLATLKRELPGALRNLQKGNIAPVDLAQAAIGPGMAVFSRYARVLETNGSPMSVRTALALINQMLDEVLAEQEGEFDADTRWALAWFDQFGFAEGPYGQAETLSTAKNTSVSGMVEAGILAAKGGKVRLLKKDELPGDWDPATDKRLTIWETTHHLIRRLDQGESGAAELIQKLGPIAETARDLAYRLYTICERRKWAQEAIAYNSMVLSWGDMQRLAEERKAAAAPTQGELI